MTRVLLTAATAPELAPLLAGFADPQPLTPRLARYVVGRLEVDVLITGVGMVATAAWCSRTLSERHYDLALNTGVCGSFDPALTAGAVVHVVRDRIAELGAEDGDRFLSIGELGLLDAGDAPFSREELVNGAPPRLAPLEGLPAVAGITVNTVHGEPRSIEAVVERFNPQVESMEGAAFMYACLIHSVPFAQVRAVSNVVERRNRTAWRLGQAIGNLSDVTVRLLESV
jgi:futalosine hydrolase